MSQLRYELCEGAPGLLPRTLVTFAHAAIELYAEAFEHAGRLERLEAFASERGADFYGRARNEGTISIRRERWRVPDGYDYGPGGERLVPFRAGGSLDWRFVDAH